MFEKWCIDCRQDHHNCPDCYMEGSRPTKYLSPDDDLFLVDKMLNMEMEQRIMEGK